MSRAKEIARAKEGPARNGRPTEKERGIDLYPLAEKAVVARRFTSELPNAPLAIWHGDVAKFLAKLPKGPLFDLVVTSPPYNLGKAYERKSSLDAYAAGQTEIIGAIVSKLKPGASLCWQVGNYIDNGSVLPLDYIFHPIMQKKGLTLRNRIIWRFGHGLHNNELLPVWMTPG